MSVTVIFYFYVLFAENAEYFSERSHSQCGLFPAIPFQCSPDLFESDDVVSSQDNNNNNVKISHQVNSNSNSNKHGEFINIDIDGVDDAVGRRVGELRRLFHEISNIVRSTMRIFSYLVEMFEHIYR